ncbi:MAG: hypothetical protein KIS73_16805 [Enhydrobacter sp.]|nr:hypothetical protein [Enhydrobacter sp.]
MNFDLVKLALAALSVAVGTASGVAALLVDFKDRVTGRITKWGRLAVLGLASSFVVGISNLAVDYVQKSRQAVEASRRAQAASEQTLQIVNNLNRTLNPFKDVRVGARLSYDFGLPELIGYRDRLDREARALLTELNDAPGRNLPGRMGIASVRADGVVSAVAFPRESPLFPNEATERAAHAALSESLLSLVFFKTPLDREAFGRLQLNPMSVNPGADITMHLGVAGKDGRHVHFEYDLDRKRVRWKICGIPAVMDAWRSSGRIVSILDLPGSQLAVHFEHQRVAGGLENPDIEFVHLAVAERQGWWLRNSRFVSHRLNSGFEVLEYRLPDTVDEMLRELTDRGAPSEIFCSSAD